MGTEVANAHAYTAVGNVSARRERVITSGIDAECLAAIELCRTAAAAGHAGAQRNLDRLFEQQEVGDP